jgi:hypothetical protein
MSVTVPAVMLLPADAEEISAAAEGTIARNLRYLRQHPTTPHPYAAGLGSVRYHFEWPGAHWWTIPEVLVARWGDCKDLSCWLIAHQRVHGGEYIRVADGVRFPRLIVVPTGPLTLHAIVEHACGCREDPSIQLGMPIPPGGAPWLLHPFLKR